MKITGKVIGGNRIGRMLGFPTANIVIDNDLDIKDGVYAAIADIDGVPHRGMANIARKPSANGSSVNQNNKPGASGIRLLEVNIFGYDGDLYGRTLSVELLEFIRPELTFASLEELKAKVDEDRIEVKKYFKII